MVNDFLKTKGFRSKCIYENKLKSCQIQMNYYNHNLENIDQTDPQYGNLFK